jgi:leucyl-tRNA synthetase
MHKRFDHKSFESKWQEKWKRDGIYDVGARDISKEKEYVLTEWPYPSGNLHIGHWYAFAVPDIYVRYKRMMGKQVLYPMGFDAFGLPAENAAIKRNINPREWTEQNIAYMRGQLESMGNAFSWDKTTSSTDPAYYKWTQWMFGEFFKNDIAYRGEGIVNWCPGCHTVIANEQVLADGTCERSGDVIDKKRMPQWMIRITDFADALIDDLDTVDWPDHIKEAQRQWIGRSKGAEIDFVINTQTPRTSDVLGVGSANSTVNSTITIFTTRPDTLFGATYLVLAPEHPYVEKYKDDIQNWIEVETYVKAAKQKNDIERGDNTKEKTGVKLEAITAINPASGEEIPVYIADYVLGGYGTGAIMAVPAHDERDNAFAKKFGLPIKQVVGSVFNEKMGHQVARRGVYAIIQNENGEYLLQYYRKPNYYWLPGGGIDGDETDLEGLRRELLEETGYINFSIHEKITEIFYDYGDNSRHIGRCHCTVYHVTIHTDERQALELQPDEIADGLELIWLPYNEAVEALKKGEPSRSELILHAISLSKGNIYTGNGALLNSDQFNGMDSESAKIAITEKVGGKMTNTYRLRDWSIGRQRYWGVPIPIVYDPEGNAHAVPKEHLPWILPEDVDFTPTGVPPLAKSTELKERTERIFGAGWTPEVETMDTFVDSSWYYLRYLDSKNDEVLSSKEHQNEWLPVDLYMGGAEHTTMHLLYSRFWQKALYKLDLVTHLEPYKMRINRGLILGPDGNKMSKSKGNVVDPDEQVQLVGADTVKMYLAFMGPYQGSNYPWDLGGVAGLRRFLERVYGLTQHLTTEEAKETTTLLHKTIKKVGEDITTFKFNTAISAMMIFMNQAEKGGLSSDSYTSFLRLLAPFAPHVTEELWYEGGNITSIHSADFPTYDAALATDDTVTIGVQIDGKLRGEITIPVQATKDEAEIAAKQNESIQSRLSNATIKKVIYVPNRILSFILEHEE